MTPLDSDYLHKAQVEEIICVLFGLFMLLCVVPRPYTMYISYTYGMI